MENKIIEKGFMEFISYIPNSQISVSQKILLQAAENAEIHTFGWPIGVVIHTDEDIPKPYPDGIKCVIHSNVMGEQYDYWDLRKNGDFYLIQSLFEDTRGENIIYLDVRISRLTEAFLHAALLYMNLGANLDDEVKIKVKHGGLKGRRLAIADFTRYPMPHQRKSVENESSNEYSITIRDIKTNIFNYIKKAIMDMAVLFDYYEPSETFIKQHVDKFIAESRSHRGIAAFLENDGKKFN